MTDVAEQIRVHGWTIVELGDRLYDRLAQPWTLVDALVGTAPEMVEVQPIQAVAQGRSFAASDAEAPLHTDSQQWRGRAPELQLTACLRDASDGGESRLLDTRLWLAELAREDPDLHAALLQVPRRMPFVFGDVYGPTAALRGGRFVFTHSPRPVLGDPVGERVMRSLARAPVTTVHLRSGEALVLDNHRVLHGRAAFTDRRRRLLRVLAWLDRSLCGEPAWAASARAVHRRLATLLDGRSPAVLRAFGVANEPPLQPSVRAVLAMLSGAPPGLLADRFAISEPELYRARDEFLSVGLPGHAAEIDVDACAAVLVEIAGRLAG